MMTRQTKALQLSCIIHAILVVAIMGATQTVSAPPLRLDLMNFTLLDANGQEKTVPTLAGAGTVSPDTRPAEASADRNPAIIEQRRQKVEVPAPRADVLAAATPQPEAALPESYLQEETAAAEAASEPKTVLPNPITSSAGLSDAAASGPPAPAAVAQAGSDGTVTEQHSQTNQQQYLTNHFAGIRERILRYLRYPAVARKRGWSGQVRLSFHIDQEGRVEDITVLTSSGYDLLDRQAIAVVRQVAPFPQPLENVEVTMPITFSLSK